VSLSERTQNRRRSKRIQARLPVIVRLPDAGKSSKSEKTEAIIANDHGALILLAATAEINQILHIENPRTGEELLCRVASLGASLLGKTQVGVEFAMPTPGFWHPVANSKHLERHSPKKR